jgi:hypothetical protein
VMAVSSLFRVCVSGKNLRGGFVHCFPKPTDEAAADLKSGGVHDIQVLDFLCGSVLVFFVIKIERIRPHSGVERGARVAIQASPSPPLEPQSNLSADLLEGTPSQVAEENLNSGTTLSSSGILTHNIRVHVRPDRPVITSLSVKIPSVLTGSAQQTEKDVTYRKHRGTYHPNRGQNSLSATIKLTRIFASKKAENRVSYASFARQNQPRESSVRLTIPVTESRRV